MAMITEMPLLTEEECLKVHSDIYSLRGFWQRRGFYPPFFTLGTACYLDAAKPKKSTYYTDAKFYNPILYSNFQWLYERLANELVRILGTPVRYADTLGLPGFHIFLSSRFSRRVTFDVHCDLQHELLNWDHLREVNFDNPISFTLAVKLPKSGGGLHVYGLHQEVAKRLSLKQVRQYLSVAKKQFHPYKVGKLVLHSGLIYHQIATIRNSPSDERITLQGHGIKSEGAWNIYW